MGSAWPLVGRAKELAQISRTLAAGEHAGVLLVGEAGVGKSRLAREALTAISGRCEVRWVAASASARALPLGAFAEWIRDAGSNPTVLVHGVIQALTAGQHGRPVVLGLDDAHLLDDLSAFVVHSNDVADVAKRGYSIAERSPDLSAVAFAFTEQHVQALILAGYQSEAEAVAERWERQTIDVPVASRAYASLFIGQALLGACRVADAQAWLEKAMPVFVRFDGEKYGSIICGCDLVVSRALGGDMGGAAAALSALEAERNPFGFLDSRCELAAAWVAAAEDTTLQATERAWRAAAMARDRGHFAQEVVCLQTATRFGDTTTATRLVELCDVVEGPRVAAAAAHASALAAKDADRLVAASEQSERIGDVLAAADIAAQAAVVHRFQDRRGSALSAQERADRLAQRCGSASTPALRALQTTPLTARQREILELAAQGLSNKQIAQRLNLSVRSVEGHRYRARKK